MISQIRGGGGSEANLLLTILTTGFFKMNRYDQTDTNFFTCNKAGMKAGIHSVCICSTPQLHIYRCPSFFALLETFAPPWSIHSILGTFIFKC